MKLTFNQICNNILTRICHNLFTGFVMMLWMVSHVFLYYFDVHSLKILAILLLIKGFGYSKKLGIEKATVRGVWEEFRGKGVGLMYSTYLPTHGTSDIQIQKGRHSTPNTVCYKSIRFREYRKSYCARTCRVTFSGGKIMLIVWATKTCVVANLDFNIKNVQIGMCSLYEGVLLDI